MAKDLYLPKLFTQMRDILTQLGWTVVDTDANDAFLVMESPTEPVQCTLHYMKEMVEYYPDGTYRLKLNIPVTEWKIETGARPIRDGMGLEFSGLLKTITKMNSVVRPSVNRDMASRIFGEVN